MKAAYAYTPTHSEAELLAGIQTLGWCVGRKDNFTSLYRVELTSPCRTFGWAGGYGVFAFLHTHGVIDLERRLDAHDQRDVHIGEVTWREVQRERERSR